MARNLSVLIVDPNPDSRLDVTRVVDSVGLDSAGEAAYGTEATYMASELNPNVVLLALEDPPMRGLATLEALQAQLPDLPVLVYSSSSNTSLFRTVMRAGASDFLLKPVGGADLQDAIHTALAREEQRQLARWSDQSEVPTRGTVLTVAGAKGGIGKTTISTNLAVALHTITGQEVALMDGDAQFGDVAVMLDLAVERSVADLARNEPEITRASIQGYLARHDSGIDVLMAASEPDDWRAMQPDHVSAMAGALAETHEYVVIDTPGVMNEVVAASLNEAAVVLLVTSLDVASLKDTKTALRILESWALPRERVRLLANDNTHAAAVTPEDVAKITNMEIMQVLPNDPDVGLSMQAGMPIVLSKPKSKFARGVTRVAEEIAGVASNNVVRMPLAPLARLPLLGSLATAGRRE